MYECILVGMHIIIIMCMMCMHSVAMKWRTVSSDAGRKKRDNESPLTGAKKRAQP